MTDGESSETLNITQPTVLGCPVFHFSLLLRSDLSNEHYIMHSRVLSAVSE